MTDPMLPLSSVTSWGMFGLGVAMLIMILLRRSSRHYRKSKRVQERTERPVHSRTESPTPLLDAPPEALRWQVEMHETARQLMGELDTKMVALQALMRLANEHTERLERTLRQAQDLPAGHTPEPAESGERQVVPDTVPRPGDTV